MKKLIIFFYCIIVSTFIHSQVSEGQPLPETPMEKALNQYSHLCINTTDQVIDYKPESHLKLGGFGHNYVEYVLTEELDHFSINLIPLGAVNSAGLKIELMLENEVYGFEFDGYGDLLELNGDDIPNSVVSTEKTPIVLGIDDGRLILEINGNLIRSQEISESTEGARVKLTTFEAQDDCFWFFIDASYRRSLSYANFVDAELTVSEGESTSVCIDLTKANVGADAVFRISLLPNASPHFDDFQPVDLIIPAGGTGEVCFELFTDDINQIDDQNEVYLFTLELISGSHIGVGDKDILKVKVRDDFLPYDNNLAPGDIMFTGFENDIGGGSDQIMFTNLVPLNPGTSFQLTNARYEADNNRFTNTSAGFSSVKFEYTGPNTLPVNSIFCIFTGNNLDLPYTNIDRVEINGVEETSLFEISEEGSSRDENLEIDETNNKSLFIVQGQWAFDDQEGVLNGKVITGIHIGGFWSIDQNPVSTFSNEHPDLECIGVQGPTGPGLHWAYYQCESPFFTSSLELRKNLADFVSWESGTDLANQYSLPSGICTSTCIVNDNHIPLAWNVFPQDITVECDASDNPNGEISAWLASVGNGTYIGSCSNIIPYNNYTSINANGCGTYEVTFTVLADDCSEIITSGATITVVDIVAPTFTGIDPSIVVSCNAPENTSNYGALDNCTLTEEIDFSFTETLISSDANYDVYERVFVAVDNCGNQATFTQTQSVSKTDVSVEIDLADGYDFCKDDELIIASTVSGQSGVVNYSWKYFDNNNAIQDTANSASFFLSENAAKPSGRIELTVTNGSCIAVDEVLVNGSTFTFGAEYTEFEICKGETYTVSPTPLGNEEVVTFRWYVSNTNEFLHDRPSFFWDGSKSYNSFYVIATDSKGCSTKHYYDIIENELIVDLVDEDYNTIPGVIYTCSGDQVELYADPVYNGSNQGLNIEYTWKRGSNVLSIDNDISVSPTVTTTYTLETKVEFCTVIKTITIVVDPVEIGMESFISFCENSEFIVESEASGGQGDFLYEWYEVNGSIETQVGDDPSLAFTLSAAEFNSPTVPTVSKLYRLYVIDLFDRFDPYDDYDSYSTAGTDLGDYCVYSKDVTVNAIVNTISINLDDEYFSCQNEDILLSVPSLSNYNYQWINTQTNTIISSTNTISIVNAQQSYSIRLIVSNQDGCEKEKNISLVVEDDVPPSIFCPGNLTITSDAQCNFDIPDYTAAITASDQCGIQNISINQPFVGEVTSAMTFTVSAIAYDNFGNGASCSFSVSLRPIFASFPSDMTIACEDGCCFNDTGEASSCDPTLDIMAFDSDPSSCPSDLSSSSSKSSTNRQADSPCGACGTLIRTWRITYPNGDIYEQDQIITVVDTESPSIQVTDITICEGDYSQNADYSSYLNLSDCTPDDELIIELDGPDYPNNQSLYTRYYVVTDKCGNSSSSEQSINLIDCNAQKLGEAESRSVYKDFRIYPNPATSHFTLEYNSEKEEPGGILIYKTSGELVHSTTLDITEGLNSQKINTQDFFSGMYIVRLRTSEKEFIEKLIIVK